MIDGYRTKDGKVIVVDYDIYNTGREKEREYQDNIEELLMAENVREFLYDYRSKVKESIGKNNHEIKEWKDERSCRIIVISVVTVLVGVISAIFKPVLLFGSILIGSILGIKFANDCTKMIRYCERKLAGEELTLEGIEEEIEKNKIELRRLVNDKRVECENIKGRNYVQLNYVQKLKELKDYLELWRVVGEGEEKLLRYDKRDKLYAKLADDFEQEDIKTMRRILNRNKRKY